MHRVTEPGGPNAGHTVLPSDSYGKSSSEDSSEGSKHFPHGIEIREAPPNIGEYQYAVMNNPERNVVTVDGVYAKGRALATIKELNQLPLGYSNGNGYYRGRLEDLSIIELALRRMGRTHEVTNMETLDRVIMMASGEELNGEKDALPDEIKDREGRLRLEYRDLKGMPHLEM